MFQLAWQLAHSQATRPMTRQLVIVATGRSNLPGNMLRNLPDNWIRGQRDIDLNINDIGFYGSRWRYYSTKYRYFWLPCSPISPHVQGGRGGANSGRQTVRQIEDKTTFQPSYQNKSCSECQQDVRKIERQADRQADRRTDGQTDR